MTIEFLGENKLAVLDFGGQYAHLIASRLRRLGTFSEIVHPEEFTSQMAGNYKGIILSGGPGSVYDDGAPSCDTAIFHSGIPILGICYGHQLMMQQLGGEVTPAGSREYGPAALHIHSPDGILAGETKNTEIVWMSHGDEVVKLPEGFKILGSTEDCRFAAVGDLEKKIFGVQFHPEVHDTSRGDAYLMNFIRICGLENTWDLDAYLEEEMDKLKDSVGDKKVFMLLSGGVDSTVAFALLARSLPADHLKGLFVDTGFMRFREIDEVLDFLTPLGVKLDVAEEGDHFYEKLAGIADPEKKRNIIGELFIDVQQKASDQMGLNPDEWFLGQGTIYPDTIESGATKNSQKIKTHHNRVERIQKMLEEGKVIEPLRDLYKDEVRALGRKLGLPDHVVNRHPFPGPGLAVRCLCTALEEEQETFRRGIGVNDFEAMLEKERESGRGGEISGDLEIISQKMKANNFVGCVLPVKSVGVQGDKRSYAHPLAIFPQGDAWSDWSVPGEIARKIPGRFKEINRVVFCTGSRNDIRHLRYYPHEAAYLTPDRVNLLRAADRIVTDFIQEKGIYDRIWQFPAVLVPVYMSSTGPDDSENSEKREVYESVILRPVVSQDAMTASFYEMEIPMVKELTLRLLSLVKIDAVFYDITSKPPGTIEWE